MNRTKWTLGPAEGRAPTGLNRRLGTGRSGALAGPKSSRDWPERAVAPPQQRTRASCAAVHATNFHFGKRARPQAGAKTDQNGLPAGAAGRTKNAPGPDPLTPASLSIFGGPMPNAVTIEQIGHAAGRSNTWSKCYSIPISLRVS
jgi:hypothetical protein